ncbi:DUF4129 domain-containing protein [Pseudomonas sp. LS44]|uniref:DUF4129 domain-containing protein n=1 Tax=Pseudomonas sp. LS44 TaxID=1357074 RepID=UPI00215B1598|nr:DUF4129 domain-containing protein [Pseudomonas sp. LS44]UVE18686.1 DUF4129 domain-containing protein [Pseudomonas sp. LS44]
MRLTDSSVAIRPRTAWEAMDLGVLLARRHAGLLMASWALITLPIFALLTLLLWNYPSWALLLFWLCKPAYERLPLHILSRALFGDTPRLGDAFKAWPKLLKPQLLASLTWRRLSVTRSFDLPVLQLEGLSGQVRSQRLVVLGQRNSRSATWLTVIGMHVETALWLGLITLMYMLLPQQIELDWDWQSLLQESAGDWLWLEHLSNLLYVLVLIVWEPVYVACGFSLYLNRRTQLEGWDIELAFRRLRQRLTGIAYALLLGCGLLVLQAPNAAWAASTCPLPVDDPNGPQSARLLHQPLTSQAAQQSISQVLDQPPFENRETVTAWRLGDEPSNDKTQNEFWAKLIRYLANLLAGWDGLKGLALFLEALLWGSLFGLLVLLIWRYRDWLRTFASGFELPQRRTRAMPTQMFGLEVAPESLPSDVASRVEQLWDEQPREALGLLYRALLSRLLHDLRLPLKSAHTEGEVLELVQQLQQVELGRFSLVLTRHWQNLAYGHQLPPANLKRGLCEGWRRLFPQGVST